MKLDILILKLSIATSVTRLGVFLILLATYFLKIAQVFGDFWAILKNGTFQCKISVD